MDVGPQGLPPTSGSSWALIGFTDRHGLSEGLGILGFRVLVLRVFEPGSLGFWLLGLMGFRALRQHPFESLGPLCYRALMQTL